MARRYKIYAAETGTSYRYFFAWSRQINRPEGAGPGVEFVFVVTPDQQTPFTLRVFVRDRALAAWREAHGRELDSREMYALAKMRLFRGFDELERLRDEYLNLLVDETNMEALLKPLDL